LKKGVILTGSKFLVAVGLAWAFGAFFDPFHGFLGLSAMAVLAAVSNSNGGLYAALTGQYGNRSDVGAIAILSLNDGPFLTLLGLAFLGAMGVAEAEFPFVAFLAVLLPIGLGMLLGNLDPDIRDLLRPGEKLTIPFFAFALGAGMSFLDFFRPEVVFAGLFLGALTTIATGGAGILLLRLFGERSQIAGAAEGSTAGNAVATPAAVAAAAATAAQTGLMDPSAAGRYSEIVATATAQISIATLTTSLLCPLLVIGWSRWQLRRGVDGRLEDDGVLCSQPARDQVNASTNLNPSEQI